MAIKLDEKNLEKALGSEAEAKNAPQMSKEEEIGFHQGSLNTLVAERNELIKLIANIEAIMQAHLTRLKELGIDIPVQKPKKK